MDGSENQQVPSSAAFLRLFRFLPISKAKALMAASPRCRLARERVGASDVGNAAFHSKMRVFNCGERLEQGCSNAFSLQTAKTVENEVGEPNKSSERGIIPFCSLEGWMKDDVELSTIICSCYCCLSRLVPSLWWLNRYEASAVHIHRVRQRGIKYCQHFDELEAALKRMDNQTPNCARFGDGCGNAASPLSERRNVPQGIWNRAAGETAEHVALACTSGNIKSLDEIRESIFHVSSAVPRGLYALHRLRNLRELRCDHSDIVDDDLHAIALCTSLLILSLNSCPRITDVSLLMPLASHHLLRTLDLSNTAVRLVGEETTTCTVGRGADASRFATDRAEAAKSGSFPPNIWVLEAFGSSLNELLLCNCKHIDNYQFLQSFAKLTALDLTNTNELLLNIDSVRFCTELRTITLRCYKGEDVTHTMSYGEACCGSVDADDDDDDRYTDTDTANDNDVEEKDNSVWGEGCLPRGNAQKDSMIRCFFCGALKADIMKDSSRSLCTLRKGNRPGDYRDPPCMHWMKRHRRRKTETVSPTSPPWNGEMFNAAFPEITSSLTSPWQTDFLKLLRKGEIVESPAHDANTFEKEIFLSKGESTSRGNRSVISEIFSSAFPSARQSTQGGLFVSELPSFISNLPPLITDVNLSDTFLSGASLDLLLSRCPNLRRLVASRCPCLRGIPSARVLALQHLAFVKRSPKKRKEYSYRYGAKYIDAYHFSRTRSESSHYEGCEANLRSFDVSGDDDDDEDGGYARMFSRMHVSLSAFNTLTYVNFSYCPLTNEDIGIVQCMNFLEELHLCSCQYISRLPFLKRMQALRVLNVSETRVTDSEFVRFDLFFSLSIGELFVERCQGICDPFNLAHTLRFSLQTLRLGGTPASLILEASRSNTTALTAARQQDVDGEETQPVQARRVFHKPLSNTPKDLGDWLLEHALQDKSSVAEIEPYLGNIPTIQRKDAISRLFPLEVFL